MPAPIDENRINYFAETDARGKRVKFGIKAKDRDKHVYVIGKTGMGKSTLLENMAVQDIQNGEGICFIDPHGKTTDLLLEYVPKERVRDVIYIAPFDTEFPISFNVLESIDVDKRHLVVSGLMSTFKKIWVDAWSARMEYILTNTLLALLEAPGTTLLGVNRMLSDKEYRKDIVSQIQDPSVKAFWVKEFANYTERQAAEAVPAIQNKVGQFSANPLIRNMIGQPVSSFDFREALDSRKIIIINLSKGKIGDENMKLLGGLLVTKIYLAAMSRADLPDRVMKVMPNFYLFVDEFQNFANASFADILSEARKYKLNLTIAHQYIEQMDEIVRPAVFGNVGTMIAFRVGAGDAEFLEKEFEPQFTIEDLVNLGAYQIYLKLMIDGLTSSPFSAVSLPAIPHPDSSYVQDIIDASREQFARSRAEVELEIIKFHEPVAKPVVPKAASTALPKVASQAYPKVAPSAVPSVPPTTLVPTPPVSAEVIPPMAAPKVVVPKAVPVITPVPLTVISQTIAPPPIISKSKPLVIPKTAPLPPKQAPKPNVTSKSQNTMPAKTMPTPTQPPKFQKPEATPKPQKPVLPQAVHEPLKPVPLSSLANTPPIKIDPKVPTAQNVSDLKSALAAVLKKNHVSTDSKTTGQSGDLGTVPKADPAKSSKPAEIPAVVSPSNSAPVPSSALSPNPPSNPPTNPREVPEDVLANVLKVDGI